MLSLETVEQEILELERRDTSYAVVERLCWLYVVRDHLRDAQSAERESARTGKLGDTDFLMAASSVPIGELMAILNEHMEAIKVICPREYDAVVAKIEAIR